MLFPGAYGFDGVTVLALFSVGVSVFEEKSDGISLSNMPCGDKKIGFYQILLSVLTVIQEKCVGISVSVTPVHPHRVH